MRRLSKDTSRHRKTRPKTFSSEETAKAWAKANNISNYELKNMKSKDSSKKKIKIIVK
jgi:hypothetical protein